MFLALSNGDCQFYFFHNIMFMNKTQQLHSQEEQNWTMVILFWRFVPRNYNINVIQLQSSGI